MQFQETSKLLEHRLGKLQIQLALVERDQARDVATLTTQFEESAARLEQMTTTITVTKQAAQDSQKRIVNQEQRIEQLQHDLEDEREARRLLSQQLQALSQSVSVLHVAVQSEKSTGKPKKI